MENGIVDVERFAAGHLDALRDHTPAFFSPILLPYPYDPQADCPQWKAFLKEVLPDWDTSNLLQEWFGYNLVYDLSQQRFLILEGEGANGKSVVCDVLRSLLGEANVSAVPLELFGSRFQLAPTIGKLANIVAEMGEMDRVAEGSLKPFVTGDAITIDRKNKDLLTVRPTARLSFATNTRPRFSDRSDGIWRRLILVPFTIQIPVDRQDRQLTTKLMNELSGIFNWAIQGLQRLRERDHFVEPKVAEEAKKDYQRETNPTRCFLEDECVEGLGYEVSKENLYKTYRRWIETNGYRPLGSSLFGKEVARRFPSAVTTRLRVEGVRQYTYEGIDLREAR